MRWRGMRDRRQRFGTVLLGLVVASFAAAWVAPALADDDDDDSGGFTDKLADGVKHAFKGAGSTFGWGKPTPPPPPESPSGCPTIAVLDGTQAQRVMAPGASGNDGLRYQYSIYNIGRECSISGNRVAIKVGADGRVLLGPAGAAGHFDVPIRVVIFSEAEQKAVESRLYRVSASIPSGQSATPFQFVSDNLIVPVAAGRNAGDYSIKVGIDSKGGGDIGPAKIHHRRQKPTQQSASQQ